MAGVVQGEPYLSLLAAIMDPKAMDIGWRKFPSWIQGPCGRFWAELGNLNAKVIFETYWRSEGKNPLPEYHPKNTCAYCFRCELNKEPKIDCGEE